jgi:hypothetical protein
MWMVDPKILCRQHLLGEHNELHMFAGSIAKGKSIAGYIEKGLVEIHSIKSRHQELALEMERRGYKHQSSLKEFPSYAAGKVNPAKSMIDLIGRCKICSENLKEAKRISSMNQRSKIQTE